MNRKDIVNVGIDEVIYWQLKQRALDNRVTVRSLINTMLREYMNRDLFAPWIAKMKAEEDKQ